MLVKGYITMMTTFGTKENAKQIKVRYLFIDVPFSYNIIGCHAFNQLGSPYLHCTFAWNIHSHRGERGLSKEINKFQEVLHKEPAED